MHLRPRRRGLGAEAADVAAGRRRSRRASRRKRCSSAIFDVVPGLIGGGGDLTGNTGTLVKGVGDPHARGRERPHHPLRHPRARHGARPRTAWRCRACCPFVGTFFVFSDYMRPSVRLAAMMRAKVAFVWTHDSVGVGEDGPTHQPIEQLASLRAMPGLRVIRRADANEVAAAWRVHIDGDGPTAIILTRQKLPGPRRHRRTRARRRARAARTCSSTKTATRPTSCSSAPAPRCRVCVGARELLAARGHRGARRVDAVVGPVRGAARRRTASTVLPPGMPTLAVEAGVELRLGAVGRRRRRDRPLRRVGAGRRRAREVRVHARERRRARARAARERTQP